MSVQPWDARTAAAIGIDWLIAALAPAGEFGRAHRAAERPFGPGDEARARARIAAVADAARAVEPERFARFQAALASAPDPRPIVARAVAGDVLDDVDFFELTRFLDAVSAVRALAGDNDFGAVPAVEADARLETLLAPGRTPLRTFYLDDAFDAELARAREEAERCQTAYDLARTRVLERVASGLGVEHVRDGEFVIMRDELRGPLPPEVRVLREAPAYLLCEIALDAPGLEALAARDAAAERVADCEERVRARLSAAVAESAVTLHHVCDALGALDAFVACARFAQRHAAVVPEIVSTSSFAFSEARYLPLAEALAEDGRSYEPISLELDGAGVLTGPNMGGKTAALRTCGFLAACVAFGVPVPARAARLPLFDDVTWIGIAAPEAGAQPAADSLGGREARLLSAFGAEVLALRGFLERNARRPLLLADEFARTTSPHEGRALLIALLERLRERGACALAATHLHGVAAAAGVTHYAIVGLKEVPSRDGAPLDLHAALERIGRAMDYRIVRVDGDAPPRADALALADVLGLDPELIARARAAL